MEIKFMNLRKAQEQMLFENESAAAQCRRAGARQAPTPFIEAVLGHAHRGRARTEEAAQ
jgi:hypothetical protein